MAKQDHDSRFGGARRMTDKTGRDWIIIALLVTGSSSPSRPSVAAIISGFP